ncbi:hypothetical protein BGZ76_000827, partial [Entomortierella beljakovae]
VTIRFNGVDLAHFVTPSSPTVVREDRVQTSVGPSDLYILDGQEKAFANFMATVLMGSSVTLTLKGKLSATLGVSLLKDILPFNIPSIGFSAPITLLGFNHFVNVKYLAQISATRGPSGEFILKSRISVPNDSQFNFDLGNIKLKTMDMAGNYVGITTLLDMNLQIGNNEIIAITVSSNEAVYNAVISQATTFYFSGYEDSSPISVVAASTSLLKIRVEVPILSPIVISAA